MTKPLPKQRRRRSDTKFENKFAEQLRSGIRYKKHLTIAHLCMKWKICKTTYLNWVARYPEFARAHELGEAHYEAYLQDRLHASLEGTEKVNAACLQFALTNVIGWSTKVSVATNTEESIGAITINIMPAPQRNALIQIPEECIEGQLVLPSNVVPINGK